MIVINTRVLNGLPVRVEAEVSNDRDHGVIVENIELYWNKKSKLGQYRRATVIENKMTSNDWRLVEQEILQMMWWASVAEEESHTLQFGPEFSI